MLTFIVNCINTIKLKYKSIQQANSHSFPLRIIGQELANGDVVYIVQIVRKNLIFKLSAKELLNDNQLLKELPPYDLIKILSNSNKKIDKKDNLILFPCRSHYKIMAKSYDHINQQTIFTIEITRANNTIQKKLTALEILKNPLILEKLSHQETYDLGFTVGSEAILKEVQKLACLQ